MKMYLDPYEWEETVSNEWEETVPNEWEETVANETGEKVLQDISLNNMNKYG